jgi:hypothetical protein
MGSNIMNNAAYTVRPGWKPLFTYGALASLLLVIIIVIQLIVFIVAPPPITGNVQDWFSVFHKNKLLGLVSFELLMVVYAILSLLVSLALSAFLWHAHKAPIAVFIALSIVGVVCFIDSRPAFEMLHLSNQYQTADSNVQKAAILASGEGMLAVFHGTAFYVSYVLGSIAGIIISIVMLQSNVFSKVTAYTRIASSVFDFGLFIPVVGLYVSLLSVVFLLVFDILVARKLFTLSKSE